VTRLHTEAEDRARQLLSHNRDALDAVIAALLEKETISGDDLSEIVSRSQGAGDGRPLRAGALSTNPKATSHK
jgi:ATP-dependent Zn protease